MGQPAKLKPREFGTNWRLACTVRPDGSIEGAGTETLALAGILQAVDALHRANHLLERMVRVFECPNTQAGFRALRSIARTERARLLAAEKRRRRK